MKEFENIRELVEASGADKELKAEMFALLRLWGLAPKGEVDTDWLVDQIWGAYRYESNKINDYFRMLKDSPWTPERELHTFRLAAFSPARSWKIKGFAGFSHNLVGTNWE